MGIRSWFGFGRKRHKPSLIRNQRDNAKLQRIQQAAAADIAAVRENDRRSESGGDGSQEPAGQ